MQARIAAAPRAFARYVRAEQVRYGTLVVLPSCLFFCVFLVYPVLFSFYLGFYRWSPLDASPTPVGLSSYRTLLSDLPWTGQW